MQRHPRTFYNEADAIKDARDRGQCRVFAEHRPGGTWGSSTTVRWSSVPVEVAYASRGVLRVRWQHATPVELDQAGAIERPRGAA